MTTHVVVLLSGSGTLCTALLDAIDAGEVDARVVAVVSGREDAQGLARARERGIPAGAHPPAAGSDRAVWDAAVWSAGSESPPVGSGRQANSERAITAVPPPQLARPAAGSSRGADGRAAPRGAPGGALQPTSTTLVNRIGAPPTDAGGRNHRSAPTRRGPS